MQASEYTTAFLKAALAANSDASCPRCHGTGRLGFYDVSHLVPLPCPRCRNRARERKPENEAPKTE